ncbi:MAG: hypothetical protein FWG63_01170 [Defluviitaleaceae bacterium]|nr:hypothetical protein [Defluviitaleaceae bacterium]
MTNLKTLKKKPAVYIALATALALVLLFTVIYPARDNESTSLSPDDVDLQHVTDVASSPTENPDGFDSDELYTAEQTHIVQTPIVTLSLNRNIEEYLKDRRLLNGTTITMFVVEEPVMGLTAQMYMMQNPGITVNVVNVMDIGSFSDTDFTLIDSRAVDWRSPSVSANLADWFGIMYTDPNFNENDWFLNIFDAMAVDGRLTAFPRAFSFGVAAANSRVADLTDTLAQYNTVTNEDLLVLHERFATEELPYLYFSHNFLNSTIGQIDRFLDIEAGRVEFDNEEFENLLTRISDVSRGESSESFHELLLRQWLMEFSVEYTENFLDSYLFRQYFVPQSLEPFFHLELVGGGFMGYVPIVDSAGNLLVTHLEPAFVLSSDATSAQQAVAWDFMQFLQNPDQGLSTASHTMQHNLPTFKPLFHNMVDTRVQSHVISFLNQLLGSDHDTIPVNLSMDNPMEYYKERITDILYTAANMPMRHIQPFSQTIIDILSEVLADFDNGIISAQQAAERLQSRVSIYLNLN